VIARMIRVFSRIDKARTSQKRPATPRSAPE
jgi:hypothetical protein